jgi:hypothetical protein
MTNLNAFLLLLIMALLLACSSSNNNSPLSLLSELDKNAPVNSLSEQESANGWKLLFNGKDFNGWHGYNMEGIPVFWIVEDQTLTMTTTGGGENQDIITDEKYKDYAFSVEYKLTQGSNSGIIFQVEEDPKYKFPYETGPEIQIIDDEGWPGGLENWQISGANYAMYPPKANAGKPVGEWNHILLVVNGNHVTHLLNGEVVVEYEKYSDEWQELRKSGKWNEFPDYGNFDEGHISLQNHGTKVWFRNIKIKKL